MVSEMASCFNCREDDVNPHKNRRWWQKDCIGQLLIHREEEDKEEQEKRTGEWESNEKYNDEDPGSNATIIEH